MNSTDAFNSINPTNRKIGKFIEFEMEELGWSLDAMSPYDRARILKKR